MVGRNKSLLHLFPYLTLTAFLAPIIIGLSGTWLPAFGLLPSIGATELTLQPFHDFFSHPSVPGALRATLSSGIAATLLSLFVSLWLTVHLQGSRFWRLLERGLAPLLAIPHAAFALGFTFLIAPSGWLVRLISPELTGFTYPPDWTTVKDPLAISLTAAMALKEIPFLLLMTIAALNQLDVTRTVWIGRSLGYHRVKIWLRLIIPQLYPMIRLPVLAVLAYSLSVVDLALIIGPTLPPPLAVLIDRWFNDPDLSLRLVGAAGAAFLFLIILGCLALFLSIEQLLKWFARIRQLDSTRESGMERGRGTAPLILYFLFVVFGFSLLLLTMWSFTGKWRFPSLVPDALSLFYWQRSLPLLVEPLMTALLAGLLSTLIALILAIGCLENELLLSRSKLDAISRRSIWVLYLPLLIPQIGFLFGIQTFFTKFHLEGSWFSLVWIHLVFVLPYTFLTLAKTYRNYDQRYTQVATLLCGSPFSSFLRVKFPMLLKPILFSGAVGFAVSIAQYLPTLYVGAGRFATITTETVSLSSGSDRRIIAVYAICQFLLPFMIYSLATWIPEMLFPRRKSGKD